MVRLDRRAGRGDGSSAQPHAIDREVKADVITEASAHRAMVHMLEAVTDDIGLRCRIRDILALEAEFIEAERAEGTRRVLRALGQALQADVGQRLTCWS